MNFKLNNVDPCNKLKKENNHLQLVRANQSTPLQLDIQEEPNADRYIRFLKTELAEENKKIAINNTRHLLETHQIKKDEAKVIAKCLSCKDTLIKMVDSKAEEVFFSKLLTVDTFNGNPYLIVFLNNAIKVIQLRSLLGIEPIHEKLAFDLFEPSNFITPKPVCNIATSKSIQQNNHTYIQRAA